MVARGVWGVAVLWGLLASACIDQGQGVVRGERLELGDCDGQRTWAPYEMEVVYLSTLRATDALIIRASDTEELPDVSDSLTITLESYDAVQAAIASEGVASFSLDSGAVTLGLSLLASCPQSTTSLLGENGTLTIYELGTRTGERVRADLNFELIDGRTGDVVGQEFSASLDFEIQAGTPYESFSDLPSQHGE